MVNSSAIICGMVSSDNSSMMPISLMVSTTQRATIMVIVMFMAVTGSWRVLAKSLSKAQATIG